MLTPSHRCTCRVMVLVALCFFLHAAPAPGAAEPATNAATARYEEYLRRSREALQPAIEAADQAARSSALSSLIDQFERTRKPTVARTIVESGAAPRELLPILTRLLAEPEAETRLWALRGLENLGTNASSTADRLARVISDDNDLIATRAASALLAIDPPGKRAVDPLVQRLLRDQGDLSTRLGWIGTLGRIGPSARAALPVLTIEAGAADAPYETNRSTQTAWAAYQAMGAIGQAPALPAAELQARGIDVFAGPDGHRAFSAIREERVDPATALDLLHRLLRSPGNLNARLQAMELLGARHPDDPASLELLIDRIRQPAAPIEFATAVATLKQCRISNEATARILVAALDPTRPELSQAASELLTRQPGLALAAGSTAAITNSLMRARGPTDLDALAGLLRMLRSQKHAAATAGPTLVELLPVDALVYKGRPRFNAMALRRYLLVALADIGTPVAATPMVLDELVNSSHPASRAAAARAAGAMDARQELFVPHLIQALATLDRTNHVGTLDLDAVHMRELATGSNGTSLPLELIRSLARMGPPARSAIPVLRERAQDPPLPILNPAKPYQPEAAQLADLLSR